MIKPTEGSSSQKHKEPEVEGNGKKVETAESNPKATHEANPDTTRDEEIAKKIDEEERQKLSLIREQEQIRHSEIRIWPVWTKAKIAKLALPAADPYWLHPIAS